jgi:hypothetical protein
MDEEDSESRPMRIIRWSLIGAGLTAVVAPLLAFVLFDKWNSEIGSIAHLGTNPQLGAKLKFFATKIASEPLPILGWFIWFSLPFIGLLATHQGLQRRLPVSNRVVYIPFLFTLAISSLGLSMYCEDELFFAGSQMSNTEGAVMAAAAAALVAFVVSTVFLLVTHRVITRSKQVQA